MIREVNRDDIPRCAEVIRESFMTVADELGFTRENAPRFTAFAITAERLYQQLDEEHRPMFVFVDEGEIRGYYSLFPQNEKECELNNLAVLPQYRHNGAGKSLFRHAVKTAGEIGFSVMNIGIVEENKVLRRWYEANGAVHIGTRKFDFFPFTCGYMRISTEG